MLVLFLAQRIARIPSRPCAGSASPSPSRPRRTARTGCCSPSRPPRPGCGTSAPTAPAEDLLPGDPVRLRHAGEDVGREPEAPVGELARRRTTGRRPRRHRVGQLADPGQLLGGVDGADVGVLVQRVAERSVDRRLARASTSSATDSCTSSREPAQQTWPWLKKMPFTMPSTAWSRGASSNTMLAALPPSSRVTFLRVGAQARAICLPTSVEPVNATLSMSGCSTSAGRSRPRR